MGTAIGIIIFIIIVLVSFLIFGSDFHIGWQVLIWTVSLFVIVFIAKIVRSALGL